MAKKKLQEKLKAELDGASTTPVSQEQPVAAPPVEKPKEAQPVAAVKPDVNDELRKKGDNPKEAQSDGSKRVFLW